MMSSTHTTVSRALCPMETSWPGSESDHREVSGLLTQVVDCARFALIQHALVFILKASGAPLNVV